MAQFNARVQYGDWRGTVALDDPNEHGTLHRLVGIDPDEWALCGVSIGSRAGSGIHASLLAVRRQEIQGSDDWERLGAGGDAAIPVTEFELPEGSVLALLGGFEQISIRATLHGIGDAGFDLRIVETVRR